MSHFVPEGSPEYIGAFVCVMETVRLVIRPLVVYLRIAVKVIGGGTILLIVISRFSYWEALVG